MKIMFSDFLRIGSYFKIVSILIIAPQKNPKVNSCPINISKEPKITKFGLYT